MSDTESEAGESAAEPSTVVIAEPDPKAGTDVARAWSRLERIGTIQPIHPVASGPVASDGAPAASGERGLHEQWGGGFVDVLARPAVHARGFAIVHVGLVDDGREWARSRERLSADIYTRQVALRYASAQAKNEQEGSYLAVVDPKGRCIGVFTTGSGRVTGPETTKRVRRVLQRNGQTRKRTSRPSRRTSKER